MTCSCRRWEFERGDEQMAINVPGSLIVDDGRLGVAAATDGAGLMYAADTMVRTELADGALRTVLDDWAPVSGGYHIYYSSRRQLPAELYARLERRLAELGAGRIACDDLQAWDAARPSERQPTP